MLTQKYQPAYGLKTDSAPDRATEDRLGEILSLTQKLSGKLDRPLRILDLGAAQGYVTLSLAAKGHHVTAVEKFLDNSIFIDHLSRFHNLTHNVEVKRMDLVDFMQSREVQFDVILCLSVIHHIKYFYGEDASNFVNNWISRNSKLAIYEVAVREENYAFWHKSLEESIWKDLPRYRFVSEIGCYKTHLGEVSRPLLVLSNYYHIVENQICPLEEFSFPERAFVQGGERKSLNRRTFIRNNYLHKIELRENIRGKVKLKENLDLENMYFLANNRSESEIIQDGTYVFEAKRKLIVGERLDLIKIHIDKERLIGSLVKASLALRNSNIFHNDFRPWNLIWDGGQFSFIDLEFASSKDMDIIGLPFDLCLIINIQCIMNDSVADFDWEPRSIRKYLGSKSEIYYVIDLLRKNSYPLTTASFRKLKTKYFMTKLKFIIGRQFRQLNFSGRKYRLKKIE